MAKSGVQAVLDSTQPSQCFSRKLRFLRKPEKETDTNDKPKIAARLRCQQHSFKGVCSSSCALYSNTQCLQVKGRQYFPHSRKCCRHCAVLKSSLFILKIAWKPLQIFSLFNGNDAGSRGLSGFTSFRGQMPERSGGQQLKSPKLREQKTVVSSDDHLAAAENFS